MSDEINVVTVTENGSVSSPVVQREVVVMAPEQAVSVETVQTQVIAVGNTEVIVESSPEINVVTVGEQGPRGIQGQAGSGQNTIVKTAAAAIGGNRVVIIDSNEQVNYADSSNPAHADIILGVTQGAAIQGADVTVQTFGEMDEVSFNWTPGSSVYVGSSGLMTQTAPVTGFSRAVGFPLAATKLFIDLNTPTIRA